MNHILVRNIPWIISTWFGLWFMVFNATFNNISIISRWSVLLVEETGVPGKKTPTCHCQTLSHKVVSSTRRHERNSNSQL